MKIEIVDDNEEGTAGRITEVEEGLEVDTCYICNRLVAYYFTPSRVRSFSIPFLLIVQDYLSIQNKQGRTKQFILY